MKIQLVCVSVAVFGCGGGSTELPPVPPPVQAALCPAALIGSDENCPTAGCGLNGIWLGDGVPFRTLHVSPTRRNEAGLAIIDFRDADGHALRPEIAADVLTGYRGAARLAGSQLRGAKLTLADPTTLCADDFARFAGTGNLLSRVAAQDPVARELLSDIAARNDCTRHPPVYQLTFVDVRNQAFWQAEPTHPTTPAYQFSAQVVNADSCAVQICRPGLAPPRADDPHGLAGTAVIFAGDYYDDHYRVLAGPAKPDDDDSFNIACLGTTISKLHLLRHTSASRADAPSTTQRQAMMSLLSADYCGTGHPFTTDGVPLRILFADAHQQVTRESHFGWDTCGSACTLDAAWAADGHGAACIGTPRVRPSEEANGCTPTSDGTRVVCRADANPLCERPRCPSDSIAYVTSGTP